MADSSQSRDEVDRLRVAYVSAVSLWAVVGGADPDTMHLPKAVAAKKDLDEVAGKLLNHREQHGC